MTATQDAFVAYSRLQRIEKRLEAVFGTNGAKQQRAWPSWLVSIGGFLVYGVTLILYIYLLYASYDVLSHITKASALLGSIAQALQLVICWGWLVGLVVAFNGARPAREKWWAYTFYCLLSMWTGLFVLLIGVAIDRLGLQTAIAKNDYTRPSLDNLISWLLPIGLMYLHFRTKYSARARVS